jgi:hypothetical protein
LALVPDPRHDQGQRHSLAALLIVVAAALLCGLPSLQAIAQFGRALPPADAAPPGFTHPLTPSKSTLSEVLRAVEAPQLEQQLRTWAQGQTGADEHLALDGKILRGTAADAVPAVHLLARYTVDAGVTLAQAAVGDNTNEHKAALAFLPQVPLAGKVVTADALFPQPDFCDVMREGGGDYLLPAKDNQPTLVQDRQALFTPQPGLSLPPASGVHDRSTTAGRLRPPLPADHRTPPAL